MNARLVYDLVRMGLAVGAHLEHPVSPEQIAGISRDLAKPVIEALEPTADDALTLDQYAHEPCSSVHSAHGQCVLGQHRGHHGTRDGAGIWHDWVSS